MKNKYKIKPQRGVTYECYIGFTDRTETRARRGNRYWFSGDNFTDYFCMLPISDRGYSVMVPKDKFTAHFIPLNPLNALYVPLDKTEPISINDFVDGDIDIDQILDGVPRI